ncbi:hypothetical protein [Streptomyces sp. NPDC048481]|uniref:hypothetical protein n=1 Tax=Streptomyces sp. NPDC048481 TaxID=3365557 RepID=UPI003715424D
MADKQDRWLDRETAERLLRGESPDNAVDGAAREEAERLARTLGALAALSDPPESPTASAPHGRSATSAGRPLDDEELPGEAAALAAFRKAHADRADPAFRPAGPATSGPIAPSGRGGRFPRDEVFADGGLVRIGGPLPPAGRTSRWGRPARLGLAAALAVGMAGGVAVANGTGLLPGPFGRTEPGRPVTSVSAPASPPALVPPSPSASDTPGGGTVPGTPGGDGAPTGDGTPTGRAKDGGASAAPGPLGGWPPGVVVSCRELDSGKAPNAQHRRALEHRAGGSKRVPAYCAGVLDGVGASARGEGRGNGDGKGATGRNGAKSGATGGNGDGSKGHGGSDGKSGRRDDGDEDRDAGHGQHRGAPHPAPHAIPHDGKGADGGKGAGGGKSATGGTGGNAGAGTIMTAAVITATDGGRRHGH